MMWGVFFSFFWYFSIVLFIFYLITRFTLGVAKSATCLVGKTAIVTGGNSGIGYEICLDLATRGCKVIIADKIDAENSVKQIILETNNPNILYKHLDLASFESIRSFAKEFKSTETRLDILVNNAGIGASENITTEDGLNEVFQVNHYGPFLLTHLLLDLLRKSQPSRIIFTSAVMAFVSNLKLENLNPTVNWKNTDLMDLCAAYGNSNLAAVITANGFAKKLQGTKVTSNSVHPGVVRSNLYHNMFKITKNPIMDIIMGLQLYVIGKSCKEGAQTTTHLATSRQLENVSGKHFWDCTEFYMPPQARNEELCKKVWETSEVLVNLTEYEKSLIF